MRIVFNGLLAIVGFGLIGYALHRFFGIGAENTNMIIGAIIGIVAVLLSRRD